jgi:predicted AlkP superfamily phosphohydrolase/phosphomutase
MGDGLAAGVAARTRAAKWLLGERLTDWDLGIVMVSEPHSAAEAFWHGVDSAHPLASHPSAGVARDALIAVYEGVDRLLGELIDTTAPSAVVVFSMGGMGANHSDIPSMSLLPELVFRWALGERLLQVPTRWSAAPEQVPDPGGEHVTWDRTWYPSLVAGVSNTRRTNLANLLPGPVRRRVRQRRSEHRARSRPVGYQNIDWQPPTWYRTRWPEMRAFALPAFLDGRIRVNLRGRESAGVVDVSDYERVCDELEQLVRECVDPRTGEGVVEAIERPARDNPLTLESDDADIVVVWRGYAAALSHPDLGLIGPVPLRRTGSHTGRFGFASVSGPNITPGEYGIAAAFDVAPTVIELLGSSPIQGISGESLLSALDGASLRT